MYDDRVRSPDAGSLLLRMGRTAHLVIGKGDRLDGSRLPVKEESKKAMSAT